MAPTSYKDLKVKERKQFFLDNPILAKLKEINTKYLDEVDALNAPKDPDEYLEWLWLNYVQDCNNCSLANMRTCVNKWDGEASAKIMIVLEGPGFLEDLSGIPLVGPMELRSSRCGFCGNVQSCYDHKIIKSLDARFRKNKLVTCKPNPQSKNQLNEKFLIRSSGTIFDGILVKSFGHKFPRHNWVRYWEGSQKQTSTIRSPWFITNTVLCRSVDTTGLKDQPPPATSKQICKHWFAHQWAAVQPDLILCFGLEALSTVTNIAREKLIALPNQIIDTKFGPTIFQYHPAYFMRENDTYQKNLGYAKIQQTITKALEYCNYNVS